MPGIQSRNGSNFPLKVSKQVDALSVFGHSVPVFHIMGPCKSQHSSLIGGSVRQRIFQIVSPAREGDIASRAYDFFVVFVAILSLIPMLFNYSKLDSF